MRSRNLKTWTEVLEIAEAARQGKQILFYKAPFDISPRVVHVRKIFKNGKIRLKGGEHTFTADDHHLDRFSVVEKL